MAQAREKDASSPARSILPSGDALVRLRRRRAFRDRATGVAVTLAGFGVVAALGLIFLYLFSEVAPLLRSARAHPVATYAVPGGTQGTLHVAMERYRDVAVHIGTDGVATFFEPGDGTVRERSGLPVPEEARISSFSAGEPRTRLVGLGLSDGHVVLARHDYAITYPGDVRYVSPKLEYPLGEVPLEVDPEGRALTALAVQEGRDVVGVAGATEDGRLLFVRFTARVSFMTGERVVSREATELPGIDGRITRLLIAIDGRSLFAGDEAGRVHHFDVERLDATRLVQSRQVVGEGASVSALDFLVGTVSLIVGGSDGSVAQWFLVRDEENAHHLTPIRSFQSHGAAVSAVAPEHARKGFVTADGTGRIALHHGTSHRTLLKRDLEADVVALSMAPRADALLAADATGRIHYLAVDNPHPEVSLGALWRRVWYEGRAQGEYVWQSSSATDEFEPKLSLMPLTLGSLKAAFYALLFAIPLALMGAAYTAYFMTPKMRGMVKPTIEIMEALPTVILGFLAGLWLAPFIESHLPAVFSILLLMPVGMLVFGLSWSRLPAALRQRVGPGWEAALLVPVVLLVGFICVRASPWIEIAAFDGDMRQWLTDVGITYDQRNALVVGIAMGFAVIPTIFSIAEDALHGVPKHLTQGSLALGATPWQTLSRVVLLTASPGIFSAIMIGLGRAVGETMIVLMATGNSPVMNFSLFEGMRTLSANIAVEMPESEVGGTHFRILFLAALVLFALTFAVNTVAEIVRQRLRRRYGSL